MATRILCQGGPFSGRAFYEGEYSSDEIHPEAVLIKTRFRKLNGLVEDIKSGQKIEVRATHALYREIDKIYQFDCLVMKLEDNGKIESIEE